MDQPIPDTALGLYEQLLTVRFRTRHAYAVTSEDVAAEAALKVAGIGAGSEVIVPVLADRRAIEALLKVGAKPVFCDVVPTTNFLHHDHLKQLVDKHTAAIMTVPMWGSPATGSDTLKLAQEMNIPVLNCATYGLGAQTMGQFEGAMGTIGYMSSAYNAAYNIGIGGIITTQDDAVAEKFNALKLPKLDEATCEHAAQAIHDFGRNRELLYQQGNKQAANLAIAADYMQPYFLKGSAVHSMAYCVYKLDGRISAIIPAHELADYIDTTNLISNYSDYKINLLTCDPSLADIHAQRRHKTDFDHFPNAKATRDSMLIFPVVARSTDETWGPLAEMIYNRLPKPYEPSFEIERFLYSKRENSSVKF